MKKKEIKSFREAAKLLIPENYLSILIIYYYPDYDHCEGIHYEGGEKVKRVGPKGLLRMATESFQKYGVGYLGPPKTLQELERFATDILDSEWSQSRFVSPKDYLKEKEQKEHDACEDLATSIVQQYAVKNGTLG